MTELFNTLFTPFTKAVKQTKTLQGNKVTFVSWIHYVVRAWNQFPLGYSKKVRVAEVGGQLVVTVRITDEQSGCYQEALGAADATKTSWGGAMAEAESQAFRRAMANFGMGLEMYMDEDERALVDRIAAGPRREHAETGDIPDATEQDLEPVDPTPATHGDSQDTPGEPASDAATERQREVLKVIGAALDNLAKANHDEALSLFVNKQRGVLAGGMTKKRAGVVISKFREKLTEMNMVDPTK